MFVFNFKDNFKKKNRKKFYKERRNIFIDDYDDNDDNGVKMIIKFLRQIIIENERKHLRWSFKFFLRKKEIRNPSVV